MAEKTIEEKIEKLLKEKHIGTQGTLKVCC